MQKLIAIVILLLLAIFSCNAMANQMASSPFAHKILDEVKQVCGFNKGGKRYERYRQQGRRVLQENNDEERKFSLSHGNLWAQFAKLYYPLGLAETDNAERLALARFLATEHGYGKAQAVLAFLLNEGIGTDVNHQEAMKWASLASRKGYPEALYVLEHHYKHVERNAEELVFWRCYGALPLYPSTKDNRFLHGIRTRLALSLLWGTDGFSKNEELAVALLEVNVLDDRGNFVDNMKINYRFLALVNLIGLGTSVDENKGLEFAKAGYNQGGRDFISDVVWEAAIRQINAGQKSSIANLEMIMALAKLSLSNGVAVPSETVQAIEDRLDNETLKEVSRSVSDCKAKEQRLALLIVAPALDCLLTRWRKNL